MPFSLRNLFRPKFISPVSGQVPVAPRLDLGRRKIPTLAKMAFPPLGIAEGAVEFPRKVREWQALPSFEKKIRGYKKLEEAAVPALRKFAPTALTLATIEKKFGPRVSPMEEIKERAPVASTVGELVGDIGNIAAISVATGGMAPTPTPAWLKTVSPYMARLIPEATKRGVQWGLKGLVDEAVEQYRTGKFAPEKLGKETAKEAAYGLAVSPAAVIEPATQRILAMGITRGGWSALQGYIKDKKISSEDILDIAANATLGMVFEAIGAKDVTRRFRDRRLDDFSREHTIVRTGLPRKEAEAVVDTIEKLSTARYGIKYKLKAPPAIIEQLPAEFKQIALLSKEEQIKVADSIATSIEGAVKTGLPTYRAIFGAIGEAMRGLGEEGKISFGTEIGKPTPEVPAEAPKLELQPQEVTKASKSVQEDMLKITGEGKASRAEMDRMFDKVAREKYGRTELAGWEKTPMGVSEKSRVLDEMHAGGMFAEEKPVEKPIPKELESLTEEARKYKSAEEFVRKSGIVPEWGTRNQYYLNNPFKPQIDKMKATKKYDMDIIKDAERWEMEQVLKDKPAFLSDNLSKEEIVNFARKHKLWFRTTPDKQDIVVAKDIDSLNRVLNAVGVPGQQRELGLALGYEDVGVMGGGKANAAKSQLTDIWNKANATKGVGGVDLVSEAKKYKSAREFVESQIGEMAITGPRAQREWFDEKAKLTEIYDQATKQPTIPKELESLAQEARTFDSTRLWKLSYEGTPTDKANKMAQQLISAGFVEKPPVGMISKKVVPDFERFYTQATKEVKEPEAPSDIGKELRGMGIGVVKENEAGLYNVYVSLGGKKSISAEELQRYSIIQNGRATINEVIDYFKDRGVTVEGVPKKEPEVPLDLLRGERVPEVKPPVEKVREAPAELSFSSGGDVVGDQYNGYIIARDSSGRQIGKVSYSSWRGETAVSMVEVEPEFRRMGIGTELLNKLQSKSDKPIIAQGDFATKEGQGLWDKFIQTREAKEAEQVEAEEERFLAEVQQEVKQTEKDAPHGDIIIKMKSFLRIAGEKKSRETGELFREHIPASVFGVSSDEIATDSGKTESEFMAEMNAGVERSMIEGRKITPARAISLQKKAKDLYEKLDPEAFTVMRDVLGKVQAVSVEPTEKTKAVVAAKEIQAKLKGEKKFLKGLAKRPTLLSRVNDLAKSIREATAEVEKANRATPEQVRRIGTLRRKLKIKNVELATIIEDLTDKVSFTKMTKTDAAQIIGFLQPANWQEIEAEVAGVKKAILEEKVKKVAARPFRTEELPDLEERFGVIANFNKTAREIDSFASVVERLPDLKPKKPSELALLAPWTSESVGAQIHGIQTNFHAPMRAVINIGRQLTNRMQNSLTKVFDDLTPEETKQVIFSQAGLPKEEVKKFSKKVQDRAKYLQKVSESHLKLINRVRKARGFKPLKGKKPYIPYIINENISMAASLFDKHKFWEERTKTFKEFEAGLFTHDPKRIIELWSRSAGDHLKKNLFGAFLLDRYQNLYKVSYPAAAYGRMLVEMDIYNMTSDHERLLRATGQAINQRLGSIYPKKIPIDKELAKAIINTTFGRELTTDIEKGYITVPRIQMPNISHAVHRVFYPAKLAWNFGFAILNRQQPWAELPFIGVQHKLEGRLKMYSLIMPWNEKARERYWKILEDGGYQHGRYASGEELAWNNRIVNFVSDVTEAMNRIEGATGAERFINAAEGRVGKELSKEDKDRVLAAFSAFINFMGGKGWAPIKQRSTLGRLGYTFQQYPLHQIDVYTEMYNQAMKDDGARKFWQRMAVEGGASSDAYDFFEKLPDTSKANVYRIFLALTLPVAMLYAISRSWNVAQRAVPGMPRVSFLDLAVAISDFMEDPENGKEILKREIKNIFSVTAYKRLADYIDAKTGGIVQRGISGKPMFVGEEEAPGLLVWGRTTMPEYEKQYPGWLSRLIGRETGAGEVAKLKKEREKIRREETDVAVRFMKEYDGAKTPEEKKAVFYYYEEQGLLTEEIQNKLKTFYTEKAKGIGGPERGIKSMAAADRATYILKEADRLRKENPKNVAPFIAKMKEQGILTSAVIEEMRRQSAAPAEDGFKEKLRGLPGGKFLFGE